MKTRLAVRVALWLGLTVATLCSAEARSQPAPEPEAQLRQAIGLHNEGRFDEAVQLLERALAGAKRTRVRARIFLELGINHAILGQTEQARRAFVSALNLDPALEIDAEVVKPSVVSVFREERARLQGELRVSAAEPGAIVSLDGARAGACPRVLRVSAGAHVVEIWDAEGRRLLQKQVVLGPGQVVAVEARSNESPGEGGARAAAAAAWQPPPSGLRTDRASSSYRVWAWATAGGAVAAAATALGLWRWGASGYDDFQTTPDPRVYDDLKDSVPRRYIAADVLFGVSAGLAVTSAVLFYLDHRGRSAEAQKARQISATITGLGVSLQGRF